MDGLTLANSPYSEMILILSRVLSQAGMPFQNYTDCSRHAATVAVQPSQQPCMQMELRAYR
jgi:hypothetical protein